MRQVKPSQIPYITRVLLRTQRMMRPESYLKEHEATLLAPREVPAEAVRAS
jgi:hypothetical protein